MAFNISYIVNGFLRTVGIGEKAVTERRSGAISGGITEVLFETDRPFSLDFLEFSANSDSCQLDVVYKGDNTAVERTLSIANVDGTGFNALVPTTVTESGSGVFEIVEHNTTDDIYKYQLNRTLDFPEGAVIRVRNWSVSEHNTAVSIFGREY